MMSTYHNDLVHLTGIVLVHGIPIDEVAIRHLLGTLHVALSRRFQP